MKETENQIFRRQYTRGYYDNILYYVIIFVLVIGSCTALVLIGAANKPRTNNKGTVASVENAIKLQTKEQSVNESLGIEEKEIPIELERMIQILNNSVKSDTALMDSRYAEIISCLGNNFDFNNYLDYSDNTVTYKFNKGVIDIVFEDGVLNDVKVTRKD